MDYESVKAILMARFKEWQKAEGDIRSSITGYQIAQMFIEDVLKDLRTAYDIQEAQQQWRPVHE